MRKRYRILIKLDGGNADLIDKRRWHTGIYNPNTADYEYHQDIGEGPFASQTEAVAYAQAEVGLPWVVVDTQTCKIVADSLKA